MLMKLTNAYKILSVPYVMLCYVMLCYVMLCYVILRYVTLCYVIYIVCLLHASATLVSILREVHYKG